MRDPERIDRICEKLKTLWHEMPDQRLGQLLMNALTKYQGGASENWGQSIWTTEDSVGNYLLSWEKTIDNWLGIIAAQKDPTE